MDSLIHIKEKSGVESRGLETANYTFKVTVPRHVNKTIVLDTILYYYVFKLPSCDWEFTRNVTKCCCF